jgi:hypothetical protein
MKNELEDWQTRVDPGEGWARKQTLNEAWCESDKRVEDAPRFLRRDTERRGVGDEAAYGAPQRVLRGVRRRAAVGGGGDAPLRRGPGKVWCMLVYTTFHVPLFCCR